MSKRRRLFLLIALIVCAISGTAMAIASAAPAEQAGIQATDEPEQGEKWSSVLLCSRVVGKCEGTSDSTTLMVPAGGTLTVSVSSAYEAQDEEKVRFWTDRGHFVELGAGGTKTWSNLTGGEISVIVVHAYAGQQTETPGSCYAHAETAPAPPTPTPSPTVTSTPTMTPTPTMTATLTITPTATITSTVTATPIVITPTVTITGTPPATGTSTATPPTATGTSTATPPPTATPPDDTFYEYCWKGNFDMSDGDVAREGMYLLVKMEPTIAEYEFGAILDITFMWDGWTQTDSSDGEWLRFYHNQQGPLNATLYYLDVSYEEYLTYAHVHGRGWVDKWVEHGRELTRMQIVNYDENVSWLRAGQCHALEVGWP